MIGIGSDHGGFALKKAVIKHLEEKGYAVKIMDAIPKNPAIIRSMQKQLPRELRKVR